jgi:hypothetical protein
VKSWLTKEAQPRQRRKNVEATGWKGLLPNLPNGSGERNSLLYQGGSWLAGNLSATALEAVVWFIVLSGAASPAAVHQRYVKH